MKFVAGFFLKERICTWMRLHPRGGKTFWKKITLSYGMKFLKLQSARYNEINVAVYECKCKSSFVRRITDYNVQRIIIDGLIAPCTRASTRNNASTRINSTFEKPINRWNRKTKYPRTLCRSSIGSSIDKYILPRVSTTSKVSAIPVYNLASFDTTWYRKLGFDSFFIKCDITLLFAEIKLTV